MTATDFQKSSGASLAEASPYLLLQFDNSGALTTATGSLGATVTPSAVKLAGGPVPLVGELMLIVQIGS